MTKASAYVFLILGTLVIDSSAQTGEKGPPKVAIIGGGIGGASVAYFLSQRLPGVAVIVFVVAMMVVGLVVCAFVVVTVPPV